MSKQRNKTTYEWWIEELDVQPDINSQGVNMGTVDVIDFYQSTVQEALAASNQPDRGAYLRRIFGNQADGITESGRANIINGKLDIEFDTGQKVPKRFIKHAVFK
tara:strand:+ start:660 stop:974 length:315 start_codon:yes stop_codon:yes gene_type:complete